MQSINQKLQSYLKAQSDYQVHVQRAQETQQAGSQALTAPSPPTPSHELSDYLFARSLLAEYEAQTGKKLQPDLIEGTTLPSESANNDMPLPSRRELHELWSAGVKEVFSGHHRPHVRSTTQASFKQDNSFEIHPASIVLSKLPMLIRSRKFPRPSTQLSPDTFAG